MKIVIIGDGKVGYALASQLSAEGHDIVIVDRNPTILQKSQERLDVMVLSGNGASLEVQREADVQNSNLLIAATSGDEINLLCCILAKKLGCPHTIARVRNPEYEQQTLFLREELGLSMTVNPEKAAAREIARLLHYPSFLKRDSFARGRVELVELKIYEDSPLNGVVLEKLQSVIRMSVLICAVDRGGEIVIPSGSFVLRAGDKITVTAASRDLALLIKRLDIEKTRTRSVMIVGGSRTAEYLARSLIQSRIAVKIIEADRARCTALSETLPEALVIHGNGASQELLLEEGISRTDAMVTLTGMDEENIMISMYASYMGVSKCITKINNMEYMNVLKDKGVDTLVSPKLTTANEITRYVRAMSNSAGGSVLTLHRMMDSHIEALEFSVKPGIRNLGIPLYKLPIKKNILVACITRGRDIILPRGGDSLQEGDSVVLVTRSDHPVLDLNDIFLDDAPAESAKG